MNQPYHKNNPVLYQIKDDATSVLLMDPAPNDTCFKK